MHLDIALGKLEILLNALQQNKECFDNYYYEVNDIDLSIIAYVKEEPEFFEFCYIDHIYHFLKLFK